MSNTDPVAYTYEADHHCPACAEARFGPGVEGIDNEGNAVGAVFPWHVSDMIHDHVSTGVEWHGLTCGTCREVFAR